MVQGAHLGAKELRPLDHVRRRRRNDLQPQDGYRNFPYAGWLVQRDIGKKLTLGAEVFYHGPEGLATPQTRSATLLDFGGYYKFRDPGFQLLFCYGHTIAGQSENYAYLGLYWTWGKQSDKRQPDTAMNRMGSRPTLVPSGGLRISDVYSGTREVGMNVTGSDAILLAHATFGVLGTILAMFVFVEALNASEQNAQRIRRAALGVTLCMVAAWIAGGYWYLQFYLAEKGHDPRRAVAAGSFAVHGNEGASVPDDADLVPVSTDRRSETSFFPKCGQPAGWCSASPC